MMNVRDGEYPYDTDHVPEARPGLHINVSDLIGIAIRKWYYGLIGLLIGLTAAAVYFFATPPLYKSSARLLIDKSVSQYLQRNSIVEAPTFYDVGSQIYILSSESTILPVVRQLNLAKDPEFAHQPTIPDDSSEWSLDTFKSKLKKFVRAQLGLKKKTDNLHGTSPERLAVEAVLSRLSVFRLDVPNVISVTFESEDPAKSAEIANAIVDTYISASRENKLNSTKIAGKFLQERLIELKNQAAIADQQLQDYRKDQLDLVTSVNSNLATEKLGRLNARLTESQIAIAEAKARLQRIKQANHDGKQGALVPDNEIILLLRTQYRAHATKLREIESQVGKNHHAAVKFRTRLNELATEIRNEEARIATTYANELRLSQEQDKEITATLTRAVKDAQVRSEAQTKLRELESRADTLHRLYNSVLQKYNEVPQSVRIEEARIITRATPPLRKSNRKAIAIFGGGTMLGFFMGVGAAIAREMGTGSIRVPAQIRSLVPVFCVVLPRVKNLLGEKDCANSHGDCGVLEERVIDAPFSRFTEEFRNIQAAIISKNYETGAKVIGVVSCVPNEGKSTIAANLAAQLATSSMSRTLLIDCDLHDRRLTKTFAPDATEGLVEVMQSPDRLESIVVKRERSGLDFLPCPVAERVPNSANLLGSLEMQALFKAINERYDFIIVEIAPIVTAADVKMVERFIDAFVLIVEWGKTKRRLLSEALDERSPVRNRLICAALNKADPISLKYIEAYKGQRFSDYYVGLNGN